MTDDPCLWAVLAGLTIQRERLRFLLAGTSDGRAVVALHDLLRKNNDCLVSIVERILGQDPSANVIRHLAAPAFPRAVNAASA